MEVTRYHSATPNWRNTNEAKAGVLLGIELEVFHQAGRRSASDVLDDFDNGNFPLPMAEADSSLCAERGVELICPPLPLDQVVGAKGYIGRLMEDLRKAGTEADPKDNYGMHINVNIVDWSEAEKLSVQYLINRFDDIGKLLGRRTKGFGSYLPTFQFVRQAGGQVLIRTHPGDKHAAAHIRRTNTRHDRDGRVIEVRLAKSTLELSHLEQMVDYIFALRSWVAAAPKHTVACCFIDRLMMAKDNPLQGMFKLWCRKHAKGLHALLEAGGVAEAEATRQSRLPAMQEKLKGRSVGDNFIRTGLSDADTSTSSPQQALRISTVVGKSLELQGELHYNAHIYPSTIRAAG